MRAFIREPARIRALLDAVAAGKVRSSEIDRSLRIRLMMVDDEALRGRARQNENARLVELLEQDERSLRRILDGLDAIDAEQSTSATGIDVIDLASRRDAKRPGERS